MVHVHSLVPRLSDLFNVHKKRVGAQDPFSHDKHHPHIQGRKGGGSWWISEGELYFQVLQFDVWKIIWCLIPRLPNLFNVHEKKEGANLTWQTLAWCHEREVVNNCQFWIGPPTSVYQIQVFKDSTFKDSTYKALATPANHWPVLENRVAVILGWDIPMWLEYFSILDLSMVAHACKCIHLKHCGASLNFCLLHLVSGRTKCPINSVFIDHIQLTKLSRGVTTLLNNDYWAYHIHI